MRTLDIQPFEQGVELLLSKLFWKKVYAGWTMISETKFMTLGLMEGEHVHRTYLLFLHGEVHLLYDLRVIQGGTGLHHHHSFYLTREDSFDYKKNYQVYIKSY